MTKLFLYSICFISFQCISQNMYISGGNDFSAAVCSDGKVWVWGNNQSGQLGNSGGDGLTPAPLSFKDSNRNELLMKQVEAGSGSFGLAMDCNGSLWSWGSNGYGECGIGFTSLPIISPSRVLGVGGVGFLNNIKGFSGASTSAYAITATGEVVGWGSNYLGQLGDGTTIAKLTPTYVKTISGNLNNAIQIDAGEGNAYALIDEDGDGKGIVYSWGPSYSNVALGRIDTNKLAAPVRKYDQTVLENIVSISAGDAHCLALDANGSLWSWGNNQWMGQCGVGNENLAVTFAKRVVGGETGNRYLEKVVAITAGQSYSMAILQSGEVVGFGGMDGVGEINLIPRKTLAPKFITDSLGKRLTGIKNISDGETWAFFLADDGRVFSAGFNYYGALGTGDLKGHSYPVLIKLLNCKLNEQCPVANLRNHFVKCKEKEEILYAGSHGRDYEYSWYRNKQFIQQAKGRLGSALSVQMNGKYQVVISSSAVDVCGKSCPSDSEEVVIENYEYTNIPSARYCGGKILADYNGSEQTLIDWYDLKEVFLGKKLNTDLNEEAFNVDIASLNRSGSDSLGRNIFTIFAEDKIINYTTVGPEKLADTSTSCFIKFGGFQGIVQKFEVSHSFTLDSVSVMYKTNSTLSDSIIGKIEIYSNDPGKTNFDVIRSIYFSLPASAHASVGRIAINHEFQPAINGSKEYRFELSLYSREASVNANCTSSLYTDVLTGGLVVKTYSDDSYQSLFSPSFNFLFNWKISFQSISPCGRIPVQVVEDCSVTGTEGNEFVGSVSIFPNPFDTEISYSINTLYGPMTITVINAEGIEKFSIQTDLSQGKVVAALLPKGFYILKIVSDRGIYTKKLIKN